MRPMRGRTRRRYSLLTCLDHGEVYFASHAASFYPQEEHAATLNLRGDAAQRLAGAAPKP